MYAQVEKPKENKIRSVVNAVIQKKNNVQDSGFVNNPSEAILHQKPPEMANKFQRAKQLVYGESGQTKTLQKKPVKVTTSLIHAEPAKIKPDNIEFEIANPLLGMTVENKMTGDDEGLDEFEVAELIKEVKKDGAFNNVVGHTSSETFFPAALGEDEIRTDRHTVGRQEINMTELGGWEEEEGKTYPDQKWVIEQGFRYKRKDEGNETALGVNQAGFEITHTLHADPDLEEWSHKAEKNPKTVTIDDYAVNAGSGTAKSNETTIK